MKDENIKEILPDDFYLNNNNEMVSEIKLKDLNKIIDYITNLQEENEYSDYCNKKLREKITNLEYKITTLEDYKTRNEKAIEHIEKHQLVYTSQYEEESNFDNHLLEILQGKSDE